MIKCGAFYRLLLSYNVDFFCGVPDSILEYMCAYIDDQTSKEKHIVTANEGNAVALAGGYYLATGKIGMVYMSNAGLWNAVNPLLTLVDKEVYSIPVLLLVSWRGEPGKNDAPQHVKEGRITEALLQTLGIPFEVLPDTLEAAEKTFDAASTFLREQSAPYALLVRNGTFESYDCQAKAGPVHSVNREEAIRLIVDQLSKDDIVVATTGKTSRELFEYRVELQQQRGRDFFNVGSMGHSSQVALAISLAKLSRKVYCLDGDGALIMHMGSLANIGSKKPVNLKHIVINNGAHDSVGGLPTAGFQIDIPAIAIACGYKSAFRAETSAEIVEKVRLLNESEGPTLLEIRVKRGARDNLARPSSFQETKQALMNFLQN